jgi:superfamily II DNA/RNA helicase
MGDMALRGRVEFLVATDVAASGIDVENIEVVFNLNSEISEIVLVVVLVLVLVSVGFSASK